MAGGLLSCQYCFHAVVVWLGHDGSKRRDDPVLRLRSGSGERHDVQSLRRDSADVRSLESPASKGDLARKHTRNPAVAEGFASARGIRPGWKIISACDIFGDGGSKNSPIFLGSSV